MTNKPSYYIFASDEVVLLNEAVDNARKLAKAQGFTERAILDEHTDIYSRSLFLTKIILEYSAESTISKPIQKIITDFLTHPPRDKILLLTVSKKIPTFLKQYNNIKTLHAIPPKQFPHWTEKRLLSAGFTLTPAGLTLLCDYTDNNLVAVLQCVEKLLLLYPPGLLTEQNILSVISPSSRYTVFDLVNYIKEKKESNNAKILSVLQVLKADGTEPPIVLWALAREARAQKQFAYLPELSKIDDMIKGITKGAVWPALERASIELTGKKFL